MEPKMKALIAIFIGILIPLSTAAWSMAVTSNTTSTTTTNNTVTTNASVNISLQLQAYNLLVIVDGVANYTSALITALEARNVTMPPSVLANYTEAQDLRFKAWDYYTAGFYNHSIETSLLALKTYKGVIQYLTAYTSLEPPNNTYAPLIAEAKANLHRAASYFPYAEKVIMKAQEEGLNVTGVQNLYDQTKEAYMKVAEDLANGSYTALESDLKRAKELMGTLQEAIQELNRDITNAEAERITHAFMKKIEEQMMLTEHLMIQLGNSSKELEMLNHNLAMLQLVYSQLEEIIKNGEYTKALQMMEDANKKLKSVVESNRKVRKEMEKGRKGQHKGQENGESQVQNQSTGTMNWTESYNQTSPMPSENTTPTMPGSEENTSPGDHNTTPSRGGHKG